MYAPERQQAILAEARKNGRVEVRELSATFDVTPETIRRDLSALEARGVLMRAHGGAIPVERISVEPTVADREFLRADEKERIARAALAEIPEGGSIALDGGTTTYKIAALLPTDIELKVVTNAIPIAALLATLPNVDLHLLGGRVRNRTLAVTGPWAADAMRSVTVDVAFLGTNGITAKGFTTPDQGEARVKASFVAAARRAVVVADHGKFGREDFSLFAKPNDVDALIVDRALDADLASALKSMEIVIA